MSFICTKQPKNSFFPDLRKGTNFNPLIAKPHKTVKHIQTILRQKPTNCSSVLDHFVGRRLKV